MSTQAEGASAKPRPRGRVLVVDDEDSVRLSLVAVLEETCDVQAVSNAHDALAALAKHPFDVVVTDHDMPGGSGAELVGYVVGRFKATSVILITGHVDSARVRALSQDSQRTGRTLVLYKPVNPEELLVWVKNGVAMSQLAQLKGTWR